jgi:hypothetical protein
LASVTGRVDVVESGDAAGGALDEFADATPSGT